MWKADLKGLKDQIDITRGQHWKLFSEVISEGCKEDKHMPNIAGRNPYELFI
jgi:hypothetical protein